MSGISPGESRTFRHRRNTQRRISRRRGERLPLPCEPHYYTISIPSAEGGARLESVTLYRTPFACLPLTFLAFFRGKKSSLSPAAYIVVPTVCPKIVTGGDGKKSELWALHRALFFGASIRAILIARVDEDKDRSGGKEGDDSDFSPYFFLNSPKKGRPVLGRGRSPSDV